MRAEIISNKIKKEGTVVLIRVILFLIYYVALMVIGFLLLVGAALVTISMPDFLGGLEMINVRLLIVGVIALAAMWWFCIQVGFYLIKPLFFSPKTSNENRFEIDENDCPCLFSMIKNVAHATGNKMPKHVYLSPEVNACVFYDKASIWSIFLPTGRNLMVGIGLLHGMNSSEVKAILSHEFGHFSQQSMRFGTLTYRLMLIIRAMIDHAREQLQKDAIARSQEDYKWYQHLAVYPISFITKKTISFYNWIEKENRSLSRYMEFEADTVACKVVGARPFISSLCKLETLSDRYSTYEKVIADTLTQGHYMPEFWQTYIFVYGQLSNSDKLTVEKDTSLDGPIGDSAKYLSKISIVDGWNTHPSLSERIDNARQYVNVNETTYTDDPADLVGLKMLNAVGEMRQCFIAANLQQPVDLKKLSAMSQKDFEESFSNHYGEQLGHYFLSTFINKRIHSFAFPNENEVKTEHVENPFTEANRNLILEYNQGFNDFRLLEQIKSREIDARHFIYDGKLYADVDEPLALQNEYLKPLYKKWCDLDLEIYKFLWQNTERKGALNAIYWTIMYANDASQAFDPIRQKSEEISEGLAFYQSHGSEVAVTDEMSMALSTELWKFLQNFDFETVQSLFGNVESNGVSLSKIMDGWKQISLLKQHPRMKDTDLLDTIGEIASFLDYMLEVGNGEWRKILIKVYDNQYHGQANKDVNIKI